LQTDRGFIERRTKSVSSVAYAQMAIVIEIADIGHGNVSFIITITIAVDIGDDRRRAFASREEAKREAKY
jgi:hypothetical protein